MTTYNASLLTLPVEILHHIIDYLDTPTIFLSFPNVCTYLRAISHTYNRYQLDFNSISKPDFHRICQYIPCEDILSLTLSDGNETPGQIKLFLSLFNIEQFTRLLSLTLLEIDDDNLSQILCLDITSTLTSLSINWQESHCPANKTLSLLSTLLKRLNLRRLTLKTSSYTIGEISWPVQCTLEHLTLMYITQKQYCTLLRETPNLRTLVLNHCSMHQINDNISTLSVPVSYKQLTSLILIDSRMSMNGLTSILSITPSLIYLKIICLPDSFDTIIDGCHWEQFIRANLPVLHRFEFFFTNIYNAYYEPRDVESIISRFRTPFWSEEKHWFVTCDYINYLNQVMLYTTPLCTTDFTYECEANKVSYSTSIAMDDYALITDNVRTINLTLTKLMAGTVTAKVCSMCSSKLSKFLWQSSYQRCSQDLILFLSKFCAMFFSLKCAFDVFQNWGEMEKKYVYRTIVF